jgi:hypothetical protein
VNKFDLSMPTGVSFFPTLEEKDKISRNMEEVLE